jgi:hypothetical protein
MANETRRRKDPLINRCRFGALALATWAAAVSLAACSVGITDNIPGTPRPGGTSSSGRLVTHAACDTGGAFGQDFVTITITPS